MRTEAFRARGAGHAGIGRGGGHGHGRERAVVVAVAAAIAIGAALTGCTEPGAASKAGGSASAVAVREEADSKGRIEIDAALITDGRVKVSPVERRRLDGEIVIAGEATPSEEGEAEVGALVAGRVATLEVAEGDRVKRGQVLAKVDAPDAGRAAADTLAARGRAAVAQKKLERQLALEKQGATSQNAVDEARAEDQAARAELGAAQTRAATIGAGEASGVAVRVALRSPIDGVVVKIHAVLGGAVAIDKTLFRVVDPDKVVVRARLPEARAGLVRAGAAATLRPRAAAGSTQGSPCEATVGNVFGVVDEPTRAVPVRVRPSAPCAWLLPGAWVDVAVRASGSGEAAASAIVVPMEAVVDVRGTPTVFVADAKPGSFSARAVRVGAQAGSGIAIEAGLAEGDRVVTAGALLLKGEALRSVLGGD